MPSFPTFADGSVAHVPFTQGIEFINATNRQRHGYQYAYNVLANGIKRWEIEFSLPDADLATLQAFWEARYGKYEEFDFTDPVSLATTTKCRFDQDVLEVRQVGPDENLVRVAIQEYL
jgi:hypothetical protein